MAFRTVLFHQLSLPDILILFYIQDLSQFCLILGAPCSFLFEVIDPSFTLYAELSAE